LIAERRQAFPEQVCFLSVAGDNRKRSGIARRLLCPILRVADLPKGRWHPDFADRDRSRPFGRLTFAGKAGSSGAHSNHSDAARRFEQHLKEVSSMQDFNHLFAAMALATVLGFGVAHGAEEPPAAEPDTMDQIKSGAAQAWEGTKKAAAAVADSAKSAWERTEDYSAEVWDEAKDESARAWDEAKAESDEAWEAARTTTRSAWATAKQKSEAAWDTATDAETWQKAKEEAHVYWAEAKQESHEAWVAAQKSAMQAWEKAADISYREWENAKSAVAQMQAEEPTEKEGAE
jgi:hypothetical protein